MTCAECAASIPAFLDGELPPAEHTRMAEHVRGCAACRLAIHHALNGRGYITCRDVVDLVSAYIEENLSPDERARFEEHLGVCPPCRVYVEQMRQTIQALGALSEETLSEEEKVNLLVAFRDWTTPRSSESTAPE